jgi:hypothetical protein
VGEEYPNVIVSSKHRVPGRLRLGGAIKARRLTKRPKIERSFLAEESSESSSDDTSSGSGEIWEELEMGKDEVRLG